MVALFFVRLGVNLFSIIPFRLLYILSDFLYVIFRYVLKYRFATIKNNLTNSFPEKSEAEILNLINGAYRNLCDILLEGVKGLSMSEKNLRQRYTINNANVTFSDFEKNKSIILTGAHYTNWEYGVMSWAVWFKHRTVGIYKPLSNKKVEKYLNKKRAKLGMQLAATYETRKVLEENHANPSVYVLLGDQSPSNMKTTHWIDFLNQDTAWLHGVGTIANHHNFSIYYLDTQRVARGFYESELSLIVANPKAISAAEISKIYAEKVEELIRQKPENWLWSHKRWKHKR